MRWRCRLFLSKSFAVEVVPDTKKTRKWVTPVAALVALALGIGIGAAIWLPPRLAAQTEAPDLSAQLSAAEQSHTRLQDEVAALQDQIDESETKATSATVDGVEACEILFSGATTLGVMGEIPDALSSIGAAITSEQDRKMWKIKQTLEKAAAVAPAELRAAIVDVQVPFAQYVEAVKAGETDVRMDTSGMVEKTARLMGACADEGFRVS